MATGRVGDSSLWFNISPPSGKPRKSSSDDDCVALLNLKEFERPPLVTFRQVDIGTTECSTLNIFNPNKVKLRLSFDKIPTGFSVKNNSVAIQPNANLDVEIFWKPTELGGLRKSVMVNTDLGQRFQFYVQGECVKPCVSKTKKQALKMSKKRAISQPYLTKPKAKPEITDTTAQFLDTSQYQTENLFEELNTNNPLPLTPLRRETFFVDSNRQVFSDIPVFEPNTALIKQTLSFEKVPGGMLKNFDVQTNARKTWSTVEPVTTENLLELPSAIKDSLSSNDTVSSNACAILLKNPSKINFDQTNEFEDSLNEPYITAPGEPKSRALYETCIDFKNLDKSSAQMSMNEKRLESTSVVSETPTLPVRNGSGSFTVAKSRSNSDSSIITLNRNDESHEICPRRVSTAKKDSRTRKFEDLGLTHDLSCITGNLIETSSSGADSTHDPSIIVPKIQAYRGNETRKLRRSTSLNTQNTRSPKNKVLSLTISPLKRSATIGCVKRSNPFTSFLKPVAQPKLNLLTKSCSKIPRHPNLFAAKNVFYDEHWQQKEEKTFVRWLNYVFTPPDGYSVNEEKVKISETWVCSLQKSADKTIPVKVAPDKETLSLKLYTSERNKNNLRRNAFSLFQAEENVSVLMKIEQRISQKRLSIREDRKLHADYGLKKFFLDLLLNYNILWLHIGLEIVFGEFIYVQKSNEVMSLSRFILQKFLFSQEIAKEYAHKVVPNLYADGYEEELSKHILRRFLFLVYFLDKAKQLHIIEHDPCLFNKNAKLKASKDILIAFSSVCLKGEGDITRHLNNLGYSVSWKQKPLEEFNYAVTNLSQDLKCGTRLARVCELLFHSWALTDTLRVPATTRTIKARNVESVLRLLRESGVELPSDIKASDIADGHREHTLTLLWKIIYKTRVEPLISGQELRNEIIHLHRSSRFHQKVKIFEGYKYPMEKFTRENSLYKTDVSLYCLFRWCQIVGEMYDVQIENLSVSFSDGRAFCYIIHHYHPDILPKSEISDDTQINFKKGDVHSPSDLFAEMSLQEQSERLKNEKKNLKIAFDKMRDLGCIPIVTDIDDMCNTIPDEKVVVTLLTYLISRLTNLGREIRAARTIQLHWRKYCFEKMKKLLKIKTDAAVTIQNAFRQYILNKKLKVETKAATTIQRCFRLYKFRKVLVEMKTIRLQSKAAITIQACVRRFIARKKLKHIKASVVHIQTAFRGYVARKEFNRRKAEILLDLQNKSAVTIQKHFRGWFERKRYIEIKRRVTKLQSFYRGFLVRKQLRVKNQSALKIQNFFRAYRKAQLERQNYLKTLKSIQVVQSFVRMWIARKNFRKVRSATINIQATFRGYVVRKEYNHIKAQILLDLQNNSAVTIQKHFRGWFQRKRYIEIKRRVTQLQSLCRGFLVRKQLRVKNQSALKIQTFFRAYRKAQIERQNYLKTLKSIQVIQSFVRMWIARKNFRKVRSATINIQATFRRYVARKDYNHRKAQILLDLQNNSAVTIQKHTRGWFHQKRYIEIKRRVTKLQSLYRGFLVRKQLRVKNQSALKIQNFFRAYRKAQIERQNYLKTLKSIQVIQSFVRMWIARKNFRKVRSATINIQSTFRGYVARKEFNRRKAQILLDLQNNSAVTIQKHFRGWFQRKRYIEIKRRVTQLQSLCRGFLVRKQLRVKNQSALKIQNFFRAYRKSQIERQNYLKTLKSIQVIQSFVRMWIARKNFRKVRSATINIQATFRGYVARKEFDHRKAQILLDLQNNSAVNIQKHFRGLVQHKKYIEIKRRVTQLQSLYRGFLVRKQLRVKNQSALKIQNFFRSYRKAQTERQNYLKTLKSIQVIQSFVRMWIARKNFCNVRFATIKIQATFRGYVARKEYNHRKAQILLDLQNNSAVTIQKHFRGWVQHKKYIEIKRRVTQLQSLYRGFLVRKQLRVKNQSALKIQNFFRSYRKAQIERENYLKTLKSIQVIQSFVRMWIARKNFCKVRSATINIQATFRGYSDRKKVSRTKNLIVLIQRKWKATLEMKRDRENYLKVRQSVICLQSALRGNKTRMELKKKQIAAKKIQAAYRSYVARTRLELQNKSALTIQTHFRSWLERKRYIKIKILTVQLQSLCRGFLVRKDQRNKIHAVLKIQAFYRAHCKAQMERQNYLKTLKSIKMIQSFVRMWIQRKKFHKAKTAAIKIQATFRGYWDRRNVSKTKNAILLIQRKWKATLEMKQVRKNFLQVQISTKIRAAIVIQRFYRSRKKLEINRTQSAIKIQAWFRGVLARKNVSIVKKEALKNKAALTIQRFWKGYQLRNNIKDENLNEIRKNLKMAKQNATQAKTLGQLTRDAVRVILGGRVTDIIQALMHLEKASRLSKSCRNEMVNANIMQTLLTLINSCNRSLPHVEVIICCANLFLNLALFDDTTDHVWSSINFIDHCLDMMKKFQDRDTLIQNKIVTLLVLMCQDNPERLADLKNHSSAEKTIKKLHETCSRKLTFKLKTTRHKDDHSGCACGQKTDKVRRRKSFLTHHRKEFENPIIALEHLVNLF